MELNIFITDCLNFLFKIIGIVFLFNRGTNINISNAKRVMYGVCLLALSVVCGYVKYINEYALASLILILVFSIIYKDLCKSNWTYSLFLSAFYTTISFILFFISTGIIAAICVSFNINLNDFVVSILIGIIYFMIVYRFSKIKKLKNGFSFFNKNINNESMDALVLNICVDILIAIMLFSSGTRVFGMKFFVYFVIFFVIIAITIYKSIKLYYKQRLKDNEMNLMREEIDLKNQKIKELENENLGFSKKMHSLAHKQKSLENKINSLQNTEQNMDLKANLDSISNELYMDVLNTDIPKVDIPEIDDMISLMKNECIKENIKFDFKVCGNIFYMINNLINKEDLEILLADHIKDAIIAIKNSDNVNRSIMVELGFIDECYGLYIYDSGIEFEKETLEKLGKEPVTTHKNDGGTGMGFMNTFDTLEKCRASLYINEIGEPCKENFTKIVIIKFDNNNDFNVISYKKEEVKNNI